MFTTERLRLREMTENDAENLMEIFTDPIAMKHYPSTKDKEETLKWIDWTLDNYRDYGVGLWIVEDKVTEEFLGQCGIVPQKFADDVKMEIGYLFKRSVWGNGYATEAALACKKYGLEEKNYAKLISLIDLKNKPSIRVAERMGMKRESTVHRWDKDVYMYACHDRKGGSKSVEILWENYLKMLPEFERKGKSYTSWPFGGDADTANELAELVKSGNKTATCSLHMWYETEEEALPFIGELNIITDWEGEAEVVTETIDVKVLPFNEVSAGFAEKEGEGDKMYDYWRRVHVDFFSNELNEIDKQFDEAMLVVCEEFIVVCKK